MEAHRDRAKSESMKGSLFSVSSGMMTSTRDHLLAVRRRWKEAEMTPIPPYPGGKVFWSKNNLPVLADYGAEMFPETYWAAWTKKTFRRRSLRPEEEESEV